MTPNDDARGGPRSFAADLAICCATPWVLLWRVQSIRAIDGSGAAALWTTWWPLAIGLGLVICCAASGLAARSARGFLPFVLRGLLVVATLVLTAWTAIDVASAPTRSTSFQVAAKATEAEANAAIAAARTPEEKRVATEAKHAAEAAVAFAKLVDAAQANGAKGPDPASATRAIAEDKASGARQAADLLLEYGDDLARGELPPEIAEAIEDDVGGAAREMLMQAAVGLAAQAIAEAFGMSYAVAFKILVALLADKELTLGEVIRTAAAIGTSFDAAGNLDPVLLAKQFDALGESAAAIAAFADKAEALGVADSIPPEIWKEIKSVARDAAGPGIGSTGTTCRDADIAEALKVDRSQRLRHLRAACPGHPDDELEKMLARGHR